MADLKVEKKGGEIEDWSYDKVLLSIGKSMIPLKKAEELARQVEKWANSKAKEGVISSEELREKVIEVLKENDSVAAESYRLYKKG